MFIEGCIQNTSGRGLHAPFEGSAHIGAIGLALEPLAWHWCHWLRIGASTSHPAATLASGSFNPIKLSSHELTAFQPRKRSNFEHNESTFMPWDFQVQNPAGLMSCTISKREIFHPFGADSPLVAHCVIWTAKWCVQGYLVCQETATP